jgi:hypothetical protein
MPFSNYIGYTAAAQQAFYADNPKNHFKILSQYFGVPKFLPLNYFIRSGI